MKKNLSIINSIQLTVLLGLLLTTMKTAYSQSPSLPQGKAEINMKDGSHIANVQLWDVHSSILEYQKDDNLHDAVIAEIQTIDVGSDTWFFDMAGVLKILQSDAIITIQSDTIYCKIKKVNIEYAFIDYRRKGNSYDSRVTFKEVKKYFFNGIEYVPDTSASPALGLEQTNNPGNNYYQMGEEDAGKYYHGDGAAIGGAVSGFVPVLGWFVTLPILIGTGPQMNSPENPNASMLNNKNYYDGYQTKAKKKKATNVLAGFGVGLATFLALVL